MDQAGQAGPYDSLRLWTTGLRHVLAGLGLATAIERPERPEAILPAWMPNVLTTVPGLPIRRGLGHTCRRRQVCAPRANHHLTVVQNEYSRGSTRREDHNHHTRPTQRP